MTEKAGGDKNQVITKLERALTVLKELKDAGVPVDGFGMQAHWSKEVTAERLKTGLQTIIRHTSKSCTKIETPDNYIAIICLESILL